jgi:hypothetical protein
MDRKVSNDTNKSKTPPNFAEQTNQPTNQITPTNEQGACWPFVCLSTTLTAKSKIS